MSETATTGPALEASGDDGEAVKRRNRDAAVAHLGAVAAEAARLEDAGASAAEVTAELARRWSGLARSLLWSSYPAETAGRAEAVLSAALHHLYLPGGDPLAEFPVDRRALVRWGAVETVRDGGLALRDLAAVGALGFGARGYRQQWRIPADAVCPPPVSCPALEAAGRVSYAEGVDGEVFPVVTGWQTPDAWTLPDAPAPVFAELGPLAWSVWASLPLSGTVDLEAVADALSMDEAWIAEVLEALSLEGLADASLSVGGGWFRRSVADAEAGGWRARR